MLEPSVFKPVRTKEKISDKRYWCGQGWAVNRGIRRLADFLMSLAGWTIPHVIRIVDGAP